MDGRRVLDQDQNFLFSRWMGLLLWQFGGKVHSRKQAGRRDVLAGLGWATAAALVQGAGTEYAPKSEACCQGDRFLGTSEADRDGFFRDQVSQEQLSYRRRRHPSRAETRAQRLCLLLTARFAERVVAWAVLQCYGSHICVEKTVCRGR